MAGLEQHEEYNGYNYGSPGANVKRSVQKPSKSNGIANIDTGSPSFLGVIAGTLQLMFSFVFEWRKAQLEAETIKYQADRNLESVIAQVSGRLEDTREHLAHGFAPGATLHDMDRTSWGVSQSAEQQQQYPSVSINYPATGHSNRNIDPFGVDLGDVEPDTDSSNGWEEL